MRNFEERKAEVFRRSEERIRMRKRTRNSIVALCLPFCIAVAILSVKFLPKLISFNDIVGDTEITEESYEYEYTAGTKYFSLEISSNSAPSKKITDKLRLENIYNTIQTAFSFYCNSEAENVKNDNHDVQTGANGNNGANQNVTDENYSEPQIYTLTFSSNDGDESVYILSGRFLTNKENNQVIELSNKQLGDLKKLLGF